MTPAAPHGRPKVVTAATRLADKAVQLALNPTDDFGRTCHGLSVRQPTCLLTWMAVNLLGLFAPTASLAGQDLSSIGGAALTVAACLPRSWP